MEKAIYDFYSDFFDNHVHLPPGVLPSEIRHAVMSVRNHKAPPPDRIRPEQLKNLPPVLINTLAGSSHVTLLPRKVPKQWKTSKTVLWYKKGDSLDIGNYRPICLLSVIYKLFTRVILNRIEKVLKDSHASKQASAKRNVQLNQQKTMFMRNEWVSDAPFTLNGTSISDCTSYVYLSRELNMMNDRTLELCKRRRAAWGAYKSIEDVAKKTRQTRIRAHLFNTTVLPALTYASKTWAVRKEEENAQVRDGIRSSLLRQRSKIRDSAAFAKESKLSWAGHVMRFNDNRWTTAVSDWVPRDIKRTAGRQPTRWLDFFTKSFKENYDAFRVPRDRRNHSTTLPRDRDKWRNYWRPLDHFEDQRESRTSIEVRRARLRGAEREEEEEQDDMARLDFATGSALYK
ncbi:hypothetical protein RB195_009636 [Necator americanus]|uniref:Reverse transcriptase domain-containing protein n=1 Tax=Necator americanus TaxID=51031 RepID=A0ABR1CU76_NECAM